MQGPPPPMGSPRAPPIKKQRAGNTPEALSKAPGGDGGTAVSQRRAELQKLQQGMGQPTDVMDRARSSLLGGPPRGGPPRGGYANSMNMPQPPRNPGSAVRGGGRPSATASATASAGPPRGTPVFGGVQQPTNAARALPPAPAIPGQARHHAPRTSDIFPTVPKSPTPTSSKPANNMDITHSPSRPNAAITAAAVKSPLQQPKEVARRLDHSFSASAARSKSAPPSRPPPPPPPSLVPEDDLALGNSSANKNVTFQKSPSPPQKPTAAGPPKRLPAKGTPHPAARKQQAPPPPEATSTPEETMSSPPPIKTAGSPPPPESSDGGKKPAAAVAAAGKTPFRPPASSADDDREPSPPATARRDLLRNMRAFADTPPEKSKQPPPPQPQQQPPTLIRSPEQEERRGAEKTVGFLSPVLGSPTGAAPRRRIRRAATPHPKRAPGRLSAAEQRSLWEEAAGGAASEYGGGRVADFVVRRPYGLATEQDLWFRAGQLPSKVYAKQASVEDPSTLEVVARIGADGSVFTIYGENQARHRSEAGAVTEFDAAQEIALGSVTYIDRDASEKEYSLDELYEAAHYVREHYASSVMSGADSLRLRGASAKPPPPPSPTPFQQGVSSPPAAVGKPETQDKAVLTDQVEEPQPPKQAQPDGAAPQTKKSPATPPEDSSPDVLGSAIALFFSSIFWVLWFVIIGLPLRVLRSTLVLALSAVLLSFLWLQLADYSGADEMGATIKMFTNRPGIL